MSSLAPPPPPLFPYTTLFRSPNLLSSLALVVPDFSQTSGTLQYTNLAAGFVLLMGSTTSMAASVDAVPEPSRSEGHTSERQSLRRLVCGLLLEKKDTDN